MTRTMTRSVRLAARPEGFPTAEHFRFVEEELPALAPGTALVENLLLSVDPYMRELMDAGWEIGEPLRYGRAVGRVLESRSPEFAPGDLVAHSEGWSTHAVVAPGRAGVRTVRPPAGIPLSAYLSVLGGTGLTAYVGIREILRLQAGESVYISAAAGAVGSVAGQIAKVLGAGRVIGSAGSAAKVAYLTGELGFDAAFDHHDGPVPELLAAAAPDGIDAALEGVGGDHLEAAIGVTREFGRIAWVGAISQYNNPAAPPAAPRNLYAVSDRSIHLRGYQVRHHLHLRPEAEEWLVPHLLAGRITSRETVVDGFDRVVDAFLGVLRGENTGKMLVRVAGE
ncbi:NADP-dependent oxidoreductase [Kitasatospora indigofera]|uniref:NADP-dependent oxidoreductase n=1 Tax=Kitasatospora indigofera TaxID=67307 RepID=UPI00167DE46E|nr:NADP-dependent oxidoreductase [Kitasatospora indigofera]